MLTDIGISIGTTTRGLEKMNRSYPIEVIAQHLLDGSVRPLEVIWEDSRHFSVDKVRRSFKAFSSKSGGVGTKYCCQV